VPPGLSDVTQVSAGILMTLALTEDGTVAAWGSNDFGQLDIPPGLNDVVQVSAGHLHAVALKADGTVVAWGDDGYGQLSVPPGLFGVTQVAAGGTHTVALKSDGTIVCWGNGGYLGTPPVGLTGVIQIAAGDPGSYALSEDGTVVVWWAKGYGLPVIPSGLGAVIQVDAGAPHAIALRDDGTVITWGGDGWPLPAGLAGVRHVAAGFGHCAVIADFPVGTSDAPAAPRAALIGAYHNPFHLDTSVRYELLEPAHVRLVVLDVTGREAVRLVDRTVAPGSHVAHLAGSALASGTYLVWMTTDGEFAGTERVTVVR